MQMARDAGLPFCCRATLLITQLSVVAQTTCSLILHLRFEIIGSMLDNQMYLAVARSSTVKLDRLLVMLVIT